MTDDSGPTTELAARIARSIRGGDGDEQGPSRRDVLGTTALASGALFTIGSGTGAVLAQGDDEGEQSADVDVLNFALTLERLEDTFYREAMEMFSEEDFVGAEELQDVSEELRVSVYEQVQVAGEHEATHVEALTGTIEDLGGDPASEQSFTFEMESVGDFLALGQTLENTGVAAYAGAAPSIENEDVLSAALSIHSVEARHAAMFNALNGESPFPNAFDEAMSREEVLDAVSGFIEGGEDGTPTGSGTSTPTESGQ